VVMGLYLIGRVGHGLGMDGWIPGRFGGTLISLFTMLGLGIYALAIPFLPFAQPVTVEPIPVQQQAG